MNKEKITLKQVKAALNHDRSVSRTVNILKYISNFLDQREIGPALVEDTFNKIEGLVKKGSKINENVIAQAFKCELDKLLKGTKFWDKMDFVRQLTATQQILGMSATNALLYKTMTKQIDVTKYVDRAGFQELTEIQQLTPGQIWNLKMREAKKRKQKERELKAKQEAQAAAAAEKVEEVKVEQSKEQVVEEKNETKEEYIARTYGEAWVELSKHMSEEELIELIEMSEVEF